MGSAAAAAARLSSANLLSCTGASASQAGQQTHSHAEPGHATREHSYIYFTEAATQTQTRSADLKSIPDELDAAVKYHPRTYDDVQL